MKGWFWTILIIVAISWFWSYHKKSDDFPEAYESSFKKDCSVYEPENPYDYDTGHYAGYEWGQNGNDCGGNSDSFIEGCEEFEAQDEMYTSCLEE